MHETSRSSATAPTFLGQRDALVSDGAAQGDGMRQKDKRVVVTRCARVILHAECEPDE